MSTQTKEPLQAALSTSAENLRRARAEERLLRDRGDDVVRTLKNQGADFTDPAVIGQISEAYKPADKKADEVARLSTAMTGLVSSTFGGGGANSVDIASRVLASDEFKELTSKRVMGAGPLGEHNAGVVVSRQELIANLRSSGKLFAVSGDLTGAIALDQRLFPPVEVLRRQIRLFDLVTLAQTDTESVVYSQQTTRTSEAAETALGTAYEEADFEFTKVTVPVASIGHWTTVYREQLADAAQFQSVLQRQLMADVELRLEQEILSGDGAGSDVTGILNTSGIQAVTYQEAGHTSEKHIDTIHRAITKVRLAFREPNAILLHPADWERMLLTDRSTTGQYLVMSALMGASDGAPGTLWGLPVVSSPVATLGTGVVAYWPDATLWMREGVNVRISDSHASYFTQRQVAVLADLRAAFSVERPSAFCQVESLNVT